MNGPPSGGMVFWRFKDKAPCGWTFGYCTYEHGQDLVRMGAWNGDKAGGSVVSVSEIEWTPYL